MPRISRNGFTLVEVLIFTALMSLVFVAMTWLTTTSLRSTRAAERKILATHYSEELREWLSGEKEVDWGQFVSFRMGQWCFNQEPVAAWGQAGLCADFGLNNTFKRSVNLTTNQQQTQVTAQITIEWLDGSTLQNISQRAVFAIWK